MNKYLDCWQSDEHTVLFDSLSYIPTFYLKKTYSKYHEIKLLKRFLPQDDSISLLEVGCATGEIYRYFKNVFSNVEYVGCDVSKVAIDRAKIKYPNDSFLMVDSELSQVKDTSFDYLFCRDVVLHQSDPFDFLKLICSIPKRGVFLRLRTRDVGETVLDWEKSCQLNYGEWAPYIIINCDEIISFLRSLGKCSKVIFVKNYLTLGGHSLRYLPKDCYLDQTGTAETAMYVEYGDNTDELEVINEVGGPEQDSIFDRYFYKLIKLIN